MLSRLHNGESRWIANSRIQEGAEKARAVLSGQTGSRAGTATVLAGKPKQSRSGAAKQPGASDTLGAEHGMREVC